MFIWEVVALYITDVMLHSTRDLLAHIEVLPQKTWLEFGIDAQHIVHHQYLSITIATSTNANGRNMEAFRHFTGQYGGYFFQYDGEATGFL